MPIAGCARYSRSRGEEAHPRPAVFPIAAELFRREVSPAKDQGFDLSVPLPGAALANRRESLGRSARSQNSWRDRRFESPFLQRRVSLTGVFGGSRRKSPAFAGSVSLDATRER